MPRFERLSLQDLNFLEKEFVNYLILNGVAADEWVKIKEEDPSKMHQLLDDFSDFVYDSVLGEIQFLEFRSPKRIVCVQCLENRFIYIGLEASKESELDLNHVNVQSFSKSKAAFGIQLITYELELQGNKKTEVFNHIKKGFKISNGHFYKVLWLSKTDSSIENN